MADPLSITASVVTIATLAYASSKSLYQTISGICNAPQNLVHLKTDIEMLCEAIMSLQRGLEENGIDAALSDAQRSNLCEIKPILEACQKACDAFKGKMERFMSHSSDGHIALRDRLKMHVQEKEIVAFEAQLGSYKSTLIVALEFTVLKTTSENLTTAKSLEAKIEDITVRLTGQMQGLQIGLQAVFDASSGSKEPIMQHWLTEAQQSEVLHAIEQQSIALSHCYRACMAALEETTKVTGHMYKYVTASNEARLLMGDLGNAKSSTLHKFNNINVRGGWVVAGNMAGESAKDFFK
ncbi:hypothetical protein AJ78_08233 [Emergomyces pasteurianus Ep9510]|uniref:Azaphilone pigments biosynthesis cluster protein L N-terminal domain-containing protein n=1 Tax=Emergomyces pasteurianus Ep9510 TaxID=1447872 RepID=A0A1J9Q3P1_9EURO|nr:hypothetical protein AJ78_08233 [Emergomyces pasteurianus Ep9510]